MDEIMHDKINAKAVKSGLWYSVCNVLTKGISVITAPYFIRILSKDELGQFNTFSSWFSIFVVIFGLELSTSIYKAKYDIHDLHGYIKSYLVVSNISGIVFLTCGLLLRNILSKYLFVNNAQIILMGSYLIVQNGYSSFLAYNNANFKYKLVTILSFVYSVTIAVLSVTLCQVIGNKFDARVYGYLIPPIIIGLALNIHYYRSKGKIDSKNIKYALAYSLPLVFHSLAGVILNSSDKIMITYFCGTEDTAAYSVAYTVISMVTMFTIAANQAFIPWFFAKMKDESHREIKQFIKGYYLLFALGFVVVFLMGPEIIHILAGQKYDNALLIYSPLISSTAVLFLYYFYINTEQYFSDTKWIPISTALAALVNIALNAILLPKFGYIASAYTTLIGYLIMQILHIVFCWKKYKQSFVSFKLIAATDIACIILSLLGHYVFILTYLRWIIASLVLTAGIIIALKSKNRILGFLRR